MATRGRGRGRGLLVSRGNETKPGTKQEDVSDSSVTLTDISSSIKKLDVAPDDERIRSTCDLIKSYMSTDGRMSEVAEVIYKQCFNDRDFSYAASRLINTLQSYEVNGVKFRTAVLALLQTEFQGKEELRASSSNKFLAFVAFLCQLYGTVRVGNQEPMHVLTGPVYQCLSLIASTGNEEEVECIVYQLEGIGKLLEEKTSEEMSHFMEKVRQSVVSHRTSARVRCMLLELLETWFNKWQPLPPATANFYANLFSESLLSDS